MKILLKAALLSALTPALLAGCDVAPDRPAVGEPAASETRHTAKARARYRNLEKEVRQQVAYLKTHLGEDRAYILNLGDALLVTLPGDGAFQGHSDKMTLEGIDHVARVAASLHEFPHTRLSVAGHVRGSTSDYADKVLSDRRGVTVKSVLMNRGVDECRIGVLGKGSMDPIAAPVTDRRDQVNDRVEILVKPMQDGACT